MLEVGRVADLKCEDVQDLIVPLEHISFVQWPSKMESVICPLAIALFVNLLICAINCQLTEMEGEDALNVLNKPDKRQVRDVPFSFRRRDEVWNCPEV
ncbi:hypothetical protein pdam_00014354 [Pocillopora damicornis]|uniref:Uncharacterized protein n=1 Tax=Pocillopora damicornis TaxID=46731 RepID=A0A3M6TFX3_POCDA|nr:hypothetical protein pdam_00014354 [Pocillopora damicornis]